MSKTIEFVERIIKDKKDQLKRLEKCPQMISSDKGRTKTLSGLCLYLKTNTYL